MPTAKTKSRVLSIVLIGFLAYLAYGYLDANIGDGPVLTEPVPGVDAPTVFYFYTDGCPACKQMKPTIDSVTKQCEGNAVTFRKINPIPEENRAFSKQFKIESVPTTSFVGADGYEKNRRVGAFSKKRLLADIAELTGTACADL